MNKKYFCSIANVVVTVVTDQPAVPTRVMG